MAEAAGAEDTRGARFLSSVVRGRKRKCNITPANFDALFWNFKKKKRKVEEKGGGLFVVKAAEEIQRKTAAEEAGKASSLCVTDTDTVAFLSLVCECLYCRVYSSALTLNNWASSALNVAFFTSLNVSQIIVFYYNKLWAVLRFVLLLSCQHQVALR